MNTHAISGKRETVQRSAPQRSSLAIAQLATGIPVDNRSCACGGSCPRCQKKSALPISEPSDASEREADRIAYGIMSGTQRGEITGAGLPLARMAVSNAATAPMTPPVVKDALKSPSQPLDAATRGFFEPRLGHDLSNVRVHTDAQAAQSARSVNALAYTVGSHIAFDAGRYAPTTSVGQRLLAHELTHVIQQNNGTSAPTIQRQVSGAQSGGAPRAGAGAVQTAGTVEQYIAVICEVLADIRTAVEDGRVWYFEDEVSLGGDAMVGLAGLPRRTNQITEERHVLLRQIADTLDDLGRKMLMGLVRPTQPATRLELSRLWAGGPRRHIYRTAPPGHPARWSNPTGYERLPQHLDMVPVYPTSAHYIAYAANTTPRVVRPRPFPTWWYESCAPIEQQPVQPTQPAPPTGHTRERCPDSSTDTGREVVMGPNGPHLLGSGGMDGRVFEERRDARGIFICYIGERINRTW